MPTFSSFSTLPLSLQFPFYIAVVPGESSSRTQAAGESCESASSQPFFRLLDLNEEMLITKQLVQLFRRYNAV